MEVIATRRDFIGDYVGESYKKTTKFLKENINKIVIIDESEGVFLNKGDPFSLEAITALRNFGVSTKFHEDKLQYYFDLTEK